MTRCGQLTEGLLPATRRVEKRQAGEQGRHCHSGWLIRARRPGGGKSPAGEAPAGSSAGARPQAEQKAGAGGRGAALGRARARGPRGPGGGLPSSSSWKLSRLALGTSLFSRGLLRGFSPLPGSGPPGMPPPASAPRPGVCAEGGGSGPGPSSDSPAGGRSPPPGPGSSPEAGGGSSGGGSCSSSRSRSSSSESFRLRTFTRRAFRNIPAAGTALSQPLADWEDEGARRPPPRTRTRRRSRPVAAALAGGRAPSSAHAPSSRPHNWAAAFCTALYRRGGLLARNLPTPVLFQRSQRGSSR